MSKIVSRRGIKKGPVRRGYTYAQKLRAKTPSELIDILMQPGQKEEVKEQKSTALKLLRLLHGMTNEEINQRMNAKVDKRRRIEDINAYYRGERSASEIAKKWEKLGYTPEKVHQAAMYLNRAEIPTKETLRTRSLSPPNERSPGSVSFISKMVQEPLYASSPLWEKTLRLADGVKEGNVTKKQFIDYLLDVAERRPEFTAYIANLLVADNFNKFVYERRKKGPVKLIRNGEEVIEIMTPIPKEKFIFQGKAGRELKGKFLELLTERKMAEYKEHPVREILKEVPTFEQREKIKELEEEKKKFYNSKKKFDTDLYGKAEEPEGPLDRKKRRKAVKIKRPRRKIIRKKPVIKKKPKCRCR